MNDPILLRTLGLVGCLNDAMKETYWRVIKAEVHKEYGERHTPKMNACFIDAATVEDFLVNNDWYGAALHLAEVTKGFSPKRLDAVLLCESALDPLAYWMQEKLGIKVISMSQAVGKKLRFHCVRKVALLGIQYPEEEASWRHGLEGIQVVQPKAEDCEWFNWCMQKVALGGTVSSDWQRDAKIILGDVRRETKAQGVVVVSSPLVRVLGRGNMPLEPFDATEVHAWAAGEWAVSRDLVPAPPCWAIEYAFQKGRSGRS